MIQVATIYFDGLTEPRNPGGFMGAGWVIRYVNGDGETVTLEGSHGWPAHPANTNNKAEWYALELALKQLLNDVNSVRMLQIHGDSMLVVNQLTGKWRCKKPHLAELRDRCHALLEQVAGKWTAVWVPREQNEQADALSRREYEKAYPKKVA